MSESPASAARDTVFATAALLRFRERLAPLLDTVAEPRRTALARAIAQHEALDEQQLKQILARVIRREHEEVREAAAQILGSAIARAPRVVRMWLAQETAQ